MIIPIAGHVAVDRIARVKARLHPELDTPYFAVVPSYMKGNRCDHKNCGVSLDETDRVVTCNGCKKPVDPFEALLNYAASEQRLVGTLEAIRKAKEDEEKRKQRDKDRRPYARKVVGKKPKKDLAQKAEPIIGYDLTLECGHKSECGPDRVPKMKTCYDCEAADKKK